MAITRPRRLTKQQALAGEPASLEELANLAEAWADMCERHRWSGDSRQFVSTAGRQLRERAATIRALLLLKVSREA